MTFKLTREAVLEYMAANPGQTSKRDIARGLGAKGKERSELRAILKTLENDGTLERTGRRKWNPANQPPPTGIILFERIDSDGDLIGRAQGDNGPFGPDIVYAGVASKRREPAPTIGDRALCKISQDANGWSARMIKKLGQAKELNTLTGLFTRNAHGGRVVSASRKDKHELLIDRSDFADAEDGDLVVARMLPKAGRRRDFGPKRGEVLEVIGKSGDPRAASLIAVHAHGIPTDFPEDVVREAKTAEPTKCKREDLTGLPLITIDPPDARDHDDAVYAEKTKTGWRVIVAIADVAAYVRPGTELDREAWTRGNSTYFPDRVIPMLPEELSADQCSLREKELRACFAVEMIFDTSGHKQSHRFIRGTMRSAAKLSYSQAQNAIDGITGGPGDALLETVLKPLWGAYAALTKARDKRQPLDLDLPERKIEMTDEGEVRAIAVKERFDAHKLIEEFMIQANVAAAETLEKHNSPLLYRIHDAPSEAKLSALAEMLKLMDLKWTRGEKPRTDRFNHLLNDVRGSANEDVVTELVLRSQAQAVYDPDNIGHFGLNLKRYAHFTSPIRRYSDLIVHRALIRALKLGEDGITDDAISRLEEAGEHLTTTERRSMAAERDATDRYLALFLSDRVGAEFEGRITGVIGAGLFIRLAETGADGFVPVSTLSDEYWVHDDVRQCLTARGSGNRFELGMEVSVRLAEATPLQGGLTLQMLSKPKKGNGSSRTAARPKHRSGPPKLPKHKRGKRRR